MTAHRIVVLSCLLAAPSARANLFGPEKRVLLTQRDPILAAVGVVRQIASDGRVLESCTGTLIESRLVLTAAHCVGLRGGRLDPKIRTVFYPAMIGGKLPPAAKPGRAADAWVGAWRKETDSRAGDWAILLLDARTGDFPHLMLSDHLPAPGTSLTLVGYPADLGAGETPSLQSDCHVRMVMPDGVFHHDCFAYAGTSGGPILVADESGRVRIVGLHNAHKSGGTAGLKLARYSTEYANLATSAGNFFGALTAARNRITATTASRFARSGRGA